MVDEEFAVKMVLSPVTTFMTINREAILFPFNTVIRETYVPKNENKIDMPLLNSYILDGKQTISTLKK